MTGGVTCARIRIESEIINDVKLNSAVIRAVLFACYRAVYALCPSCVTTAPAPSPPTGSKCVLHSVPIRA